MRKSLRFVSISSAYFCHLLIGCFFLIAFGVVFFGKSAPDERIRWMEREKALQRILDRHFQALSSVRDNQAFLAYMEHEFPQTESACLWHSCIGAPFGMRCRFRQHDRRSRIYIFYPKPEAEDAESRQFIVFGITENRLVFPTFSQEQRKAVAEHGGIL